MALLAVLAALCDVRRTRECAEEPTRLTLKPVPATDAASALATLHAQTVAAGWMIEERTGRDVCPACVSAYWDDWPAQLDDWEARQEAKRAQTEREAWERTHPPGQVGTDPTWGKRPRRPRWR